ncbi:MAG: YabP/YqfC family sporulation protein [Acutalibacteraceae bacterium]|nr:YabP/YqfC family sporulation protein [Clostridiaceae bacterium]MDY5889040.1 YabP/YqfC family sporulation protein [Oscillospiraceae bacterium]MEE1246871.1 YabP/YqfC family sporulation protein [Acutalibacteraceae bacterium]MDD6703478.1 YabP/YqfC family sporulation protein [Clostridiaceae bacterium]MDD7614106.1 YabP/YqfC family sporulation protein [Clostridiaceae bacterium]
MSEDFIHDVVIENRQKLSATGIENVDSYEEDCIIAQSECGEIVIRGHDLKISRLSVETGDMTVEGGIDSVGYNAPKVKGSFLNRVFR